MSILLVCPWSVNRTLTLQRNATCITSGKCVILQQCTFNSRWRSSALLVGRMTTTRPIFTLRASLHGPVCRLREMAALAISLSLPLFPFPYIPLPPSNLSFFSYFPWHHLGHDYQRYVQCVIKAFTSHCL